MTALRMLTLAAAATLATAALAQTDETPPAAADPAVEAMPAETAPLVGPPAVVVGDTLYVTGQSVGSMFSTDLVGQAVHGSDEEKIGDINDLLITGDGQVAAVVIGIGGFLGVGEKDVALPLQALDVTLEDGRVTLSIDATEAELEAAPGFLRADGTTSDRLGAFERSFEQARREAEAMLDVAGERAGELYDEATREATELTRQAEEEGRRLLDRGREAVRVLRGEGEGEGAEAPPADGQQ